FNVLDHNLAVAALAGKPLPKQVMPFDQNDGAGFWWANSLNAFTRTVACDNEGAVYRLDARKTPSFNPVLTVLDGDGKRYAVDIRKMPFVRFEGNECHND